jgi:hypothetical protein
VHLLAITKLKDLLITSGRRGNTLHTLSYLKYIKLALQYINHRDIKTHKHIDKICSRRPALFHNAQTLILRTKKSAMSCALSPTCTYACHQWWRQACRLDRYIIMHMCSTLLWYTIPVSPPQAHLKLPTPCAYVWVNPTVGALFTAFFCISVILMLANRKHGITTHRKQGKYNGKCNKVL